MTQYGRDQYGSTTYGGGTQARGTAISNFTPSGEVTSAAGEGETNFAFAPGGVVTSAFDTATTDFTFTPTGTGDVVGILGIGTATFDFDPSATITSASDTGSSSFDFDATGFVTFPVAATGTEWYLNRTDKGRYIVFDGATNSYPDVTQGETVTLDFYIKGTTRFQPATERYDRVKDLATYAGKAITQETLESYYYTENSSYKDSKYDTLLVKLEPGDGVRNARGLWGLVTDVSDSTELFGSVARISLAVFVLGTTDDYDTRSDVESEFKA